MKSYIRFHMSLLWVNISYSYNPIFDTFYSYHSMWGILLSRTFYRKVFVVIILLLYHNLWSRNVCLIF